MRGTIAIYTRYDLRLLLLLSVLIFFFSLYSIPPYSIYPLSAKGEKIIFILYLVFSFPIFLSTFFLSKLISKHKYKRFFQRLSESSPQDPHNYLLRIANHIYRSSLTGKSTIRSYYQGKYIYLSIFRYISKEILTFRHFG